MFTQSVLTDFARNLAKLHCIAALIGLVTTVACSGGKNEAAKNSRTTVAGAARVDSPVTVQGSDGFVPLPDYKTISKWRDYHLPPGSGYGVIVVRGEYGPSRGEAHVELVDRARSRMFSVGKISENQSVVIPMRADTTAIVLYRFGDYGRNTPVKIFLDPVTKNSVKQMEFSSSAGLDSISSEEIAAALDVPLAIAIALRERDPRPGPEDPWDMYLPQALRDHPMPLSTYAEFARARPERVADGYDSTSQIEEVPGPFQIEGARIWFGKTFYDGEGVTGVGDVGYFDTISSAYTFLKMRELVPWSVSALLLHDHVLWIGLVGHPEGADYGGGLLRHDLRTGDTRKFAVDQVVHRIKWWNGRTYVALQGGAAIIGGDGLVARYLIEPDANGRLILMRGG